MLFRLLFIFGSIVLFIGGCNGVISKNFGTHKLRSYTMAEILENGIADADYIAVKEAYIPGDYVFAPPKNGRGKGVLQYPVLAEAGTKEVKIIAWSRVADTTCIQQSNCLPIGELDFKGIIRKIGREKNKVQNFVDKGYQLNEPLIYMEMERSPLAWYWNLLMMVVAVLVFYFSENQRFKKQAP